MTDRFAPTPGQRGDDVALDRSMVLDLLRRHGCPACAHTVSAVDRYLTWFMSESYAFEETRERLRRSLGFCATHTRHILTRPGAPSRLTSLYPDVLAAAGGRLLGADAPRMAPRVDCPACASGREAGELAIDLVTGMLGDAPVARMFTDAGGFCLRHAATAVRLRPAGWRAVITPLAARLDAPADETLICGTGDDNPLLVAAQRAGLPRAGLTGDGPYASVGTLHRAAERLAVDACPVCLAYGQMIRRYLTWLAATCRREPGVPRSDPGGLCPDHLRELTAVDADAGAWALRRQRDRAHARLAEARPADPQRRTARLRKADAEARTTLLDALVERRCPACDAAATYARAERDLLLAALGDPGFARAYGGAHGLCLRHVEELPADRPDAAGPVRRVLAARLGVCAWELADAGRKRVWAYRHESPGPESTAWVRAPALLDGAVFLGGPARTP